MSWSTLKATVSQVYDTNEDMLKIDVSNVVTSPEYLVGDAVNEIYLTVAKEELKTDILSAKDLGTDNTTDLDTLASYYELDLQLALRNKQLELLYRRASGGVGSINYERWIDYQTKYEKARLNFYKMQYLNDDKKMPTVGVTNLYL